VLTPDQFEQLGYRQYVQQKIKSGARSSEHKTYSSKQVAKRLKNRIRAKASPTALFDLEDIADYIAQDNPVAAD
jgi:hypothetical protein